MFQLPANVRVFLALGATDLRKGFDGLQGLVLESVGQDPLSGDLFLFLNRSRDRLKILQWDGDGFWLHMKRLERGNFQTLPAGEAKAAELTRAQLALLLEGVDLFAKQRNRYRRPA